MQHFKIKIILTFVSYGFLKCGDLQFRNKPFSLMYMGLCVVYVVNPGRVWSL